MPELPEVETMVRRFRPLLEGRRMVRFDSRWPRQALPSAARLKRELAGRRIAGIDRRGKFFIFHLAPPGCLLVHLRMSGRFEWSADHDHEPPHVRSVWELDNGRRLWLCDARKFARLRYVSRLEHALDGLGPEPLGPEFTSAWLASALRRRKRQLKPLLLDQTFIAGLGNIYTDEALFRARLHPTCRSDRLSRRQVQALHRAIRAVLREAIRNHGTTIDWIYPGGWMQERLRVYGRTGRPCRRCGTPIIYLRVAQRGTHVCPRCQGVPRRGSER